jgi:hypothetical protein
MDDDEKDLTVLLEEFCDQERLYSFEGDSGLQQFEKVLEAIGYKAHSFRFGDLIGTFLSDNPGAVTALIEWIGEQNIEDWKESVISNLQEKDEEEED